MKRIFPGLGLAALLMPLPALGAGIAITLTLPDPGEWRHVVYICENHDERIGVDYLDAAPNFLALVPVEGKTLVFANIVSDTGALYAAGPYQWSTKGSEALLTDITADKDTPPLLTCLAANDTP